MINIYLRKIFLILIGIVLGLLVYELALRGLFKQEYSLKRFYYAGPYGNLSLDFKKSTTKMSPVMGWEHIPNSREYINSYGMIGPEYPLEKHPGVFRILVLGDSIMAFDWCPRFIERELNNQKDLKFEFEVWNAGVHGYGAEQYARFLEHYAFDYKPDMILAGFCTNDFGSMQFLIFKNKGGDMSTANWMYYKKDNYFINHYLFNNFYLYRFLLVQRFFVRSESDPGSDGEKFISAVNRIRSACDKRNIPAVVFLFPHLKELKDLTESEAYIENFILSTLRSTFGNCIDLRAEFRRLHKPPFSEFRLSPPGGTGLSDDIIHPSKNGHRIAAGIICKYIIGLINKRERVRQGR